MRWMNLEFIIQSKVSQKEKDKYHILIHIYNGILFNHKKNAFETVLMRRMNLEPIIQSEVREKHISNINACIWNLEKWH